MHGEETASTGEVGWPWKQNSPEPRRVPIGHIQGRTKLRYVNRQRYLDLNVREMIFGHGLAANSETS